MKRYRFRNIVAVAGLLGAALALPVMAAQHQKEGADASSSDSKMQPNSKQNTGMPTTKAQAEQLKNVPNDAAGAKPEGNGMTENDMPATKAQKEQLKESNDMSTHKSE